ncbi:MAG: hypothetical protein ACKV2T_27340 [Kofleriaceae bacterium]
MWLLFHRSKRTRVVPDGEQFVETCPTCKVHGTFLEVQLEENIGLFFVDMVGDKERAFRCSSCHETFEWKDQLPEGEGEHDAAALEAPQMPKTWEQRERERKQELLRQRTAEKLAEKRATPSDRRQRAARAIADEIEAELVAIKARLDRD